MGTQKKCEVEGLGVGGGGDRDVVFDFENLRFTKLQFECLTFCSRLSLREWDQGTRSHSVPWVWLPHNVQETHQKKYPLVHCRDSDCLGMLLCSFWVLIVCMHICSVCLVWMWNSCFVWCLRMVFMYKTVFVYFLCCITVWYTRVFAHRMVFLEFLSECVYNYIVWNLAVVVVVVVAVFVPGFVGFDFSVCW